TPQGGGATSYTTTAAGTVAFSTGHVNTVGYTVSTAGWTASTPSPVTATQNNACNAPAGPDVGITKGGTGAAFVGDPVTYTVVTTIVNGPTSGPTSVTDTLPAGITNGSMAYTSGSGTWSCASLTCTSTSTLQTGNSTTFTVSATASAIGSHTDSVHVSAQGDTNATNDTATKTTTVDAISNLTLQAACGANQGNITWTVGNPTGNPSVDTLVVSNATNLAGTLAPGGTTTFSTTAPQNTALTVTGKSASTGHQNVSSNSLAVSGTCTTPGNPRAQPAHVDSGSTCTGIHAAFTT